MTTAAVTTTTTTLPPPAAVAPPPLPLPPEQPGIPLSLGLNRRVKAHADLKRGKPRSPGFHPSEIARMCPVLEGLIEQANDDLASGDPALVGPALAFRRECIDSRRFPANLQLEFSVGDAIHSMVQYYLGASGLLWGVWECPSCGFTTAPGFMPRTMTEDVTGKPLPDAAPCRNCSGRNYRNDYPWTYIEPDVGVTVLAKALGIAGHMDGDLREPRDGRTYRYVLEIKSINDAGFTEKMGPLPKPEHVQQASIYGWLTGISHIVFVYVCKDQVNRWKEIVIPIDMKAVEAARDKIIAVRDARASGTLPLHARVCADIRDERACACPGAERCFGMKRPETFFNFNKK